MRFYCSRRQSTFSFGAILTFDGADQMRQVTFADHFGSYPASLIALHSFKLLFHTINHHRRPYPCHGSLDYPDKFFPHLRHRATELLRAVSLDRCKILIHCESLRVSRKAALLSAAELQTSTGGEKWRIEMLPRRECMRALVLRACSNMWRCFSRFHTRGV